MRESTRMHYVSMHVIMIQSHQSDKHTADTIDHCFTRTREFQCYTTLVHREDAFPLPKC